MDIFSTAEFEKFVLREITFSSAKYAARARIHSRMKLDLVHGRPDSRDLQDSLRLEDVEIG